MLVAYSKLIGKSIAELKDRSKIGEIADIVINNTDFSVAAFALREGFILQQYKFIAGLDVIQLLKDGIIVRDKEAVIPVTEVVQIKRLVDAKYFGINQKVVTDSGQYLGHVYDYLIESKDLSIRKFYVKKVFSERIIPVTAIESIDGRVITTKDEKIRVPIKQPVIEAAVD